jgi:hypothetical protein
VCLLSEEETEEEEEQAKIQGTYDLHEVPKCVCYILADSKTRHNLFSILGWLNRKFTTPFKYLWN